MLVVMHRLLYVTFWECDDFAQVRNKCLRVDNMKQLFRDMHSNSVMPF